MAPLPDIMERPYLPPANLLAQWPDSLPLLFFGGKGSEYAILPCSFYEVSLKDLGKIPLHSSFAQKAQKNPLAPQKLPFASGYLGLIPYHQRQTPARCFRVKRALIFDLRQGKLFEATQSRGSEATALPAISPDYELPQEWWEQLRSGSMLKQAQSSLSKAKAPITLSLLPHASSAAYLAQCAQAIEEIKQGRYYQINLLRYFSLVQSKLERSDLLAHFFANAGPYGTIFDLPDCHVYSFSPERFVHLEPSAKGLKASTYPIKGTIARESNPLRDALAKKQLQKSAKDLAELHMIVDLMRNDLQRLSLPLSVRVLAAHKLISFQTVHHLQGHITSELKPGLTLNDFLTSLCPAGSITGAPKMEVMQAIAQFEQRSRNYFMGTAFYWDDRGRFDSSVLIRTLASKLDSGFKASDEKTFEYGAGSGIVIHSSPEQELAEISAKCRVIGQIEGQ